MKESIKGILIIAANMKIIVLEEHFFFANQIKSK